MSLVATSDFEGRWTTFWATTYTFDLAFFDQYLFRRLGDPPLSANILVDHDRLSSVWEDSQTEAWRLRRVNRDYLVRGIRVPHGRFHPKTYFFANKDRGVLLVGSGNLGMRGLADGNEVFCRFDSRTDEGLAAIRSWYSWLDRIIVRARDQTLGVRWNQLRQQEGWLAGPRTDSVFVSNAERTLADQIVEAVGGATVDELHVYAPFFDADAAALEALVERLDPRELRLYRAGGMNVDGAKVRTMVERTGVTLRLFSFDHDEFVHAKLIGVVSAERGVLLSGSANCSRAALLRTSDYGNMEAGIQVELSPETLRSAFQRPNWNLTECPINDLEAWTFHQEPTTADAWAVRLTSASWQPDGSIIVSVAESTVPLAARLATGLETSHPLVNFRTPVGVPLGEHGRLAWLLDGSGARCSNLVPIDDVRQLASWLGERRAEADRPRELQSADLETPLGHLLQRLHRECVFDIEEAPALAGFARNATEPSEYQEADTGFWDRIQAQELMLDPRATRYARLNSRGSDGTPQFLDDEIFQLLQIMLDRAPGEERLMGHLGSSSANSAEERVRWTPAHSVQVRFGNVLKRWIRALADERLRWLSPYATVRNYCALLAALVECQVHGYLRPERVTYLARELLRAFVGDHQNPGCLRRYSDEERAHAEELLNQANAPAIAAALVYGLLHPASPWARVAFDWQPMLVPALELGVVSASEKSTTLQHDMGGGTRTPDQVNDHLLQIATYMNDARWCEVIEEELGLDGVQMAWNVGNPTYPLQLTIAGIDDALSDPRLVSLVRRAFLYRRPPGVVVRLSNGDRASFQWGDRAFVITGAREYESIADITMDYLALLEEHGVAWVGELVESK